MLSRAWDFLTFRDMPANRPLEQRDALGVTIAPYRVGRPQYPTVNTANLVTEGFTKNAAIYACMLARARALSAAPVRVYRALNDQQQPLPDHPVRRLLDRPNPAMSEAEFVTTVSVIADATNFCVIEKERNQLGGVLALWPLRSDWLKPIPRDNAPPDWEYTIPGVRPQVLPAEDAIVYTVGDSPFLPTTGYGPMSVILREAAIDNVLTDYIKVFFDRGAMPQYFVIPRDGAEMDPAQVETLKERLRRASGLLNSVEPIVGTSVEDIKQLGFDFNQLAYVDLRNMTEAHIAAAFGVPPGMIGLEVGLERNTMMNSVQDEQRFYNNTILPLWGRLDGALTRSLLPEFESDPRVSLEFDTSKITALQEDRKDKAAWLGPLILGGAVPVNVGLMELGLPTVAGGDVFLRSIATVEVPAVPEGGRRADGHATQVREVTTRALPSVLETFHRLPAEQRARIGATNKATIARLGDAAAKPLARFFRAQGERLVPVILAGAERQRRDVADINWADEERQLREVVRGVHSAAGETAFGAVADHIGVAVAWDLANPSIRLVLNELAQRVTAISETTRADVQRVVTDALDEGVTLSELSDRLHGLFAETYQGRAMTVGRTESMIAFGAASVEGYRQTGVVSRVEILDNRDHTDPYPGAADGLTCSQRDGLIVALDQAMFHIGSDHPNGSAVALPLLDTPLGAD